jgi:hypothetical protein
VPTGTSSEVRRRAPVETAEDGERDMFTTMARGGDDVEEPVSDTNVPTEAEERPEIVSTPPLEATIIPNEEDERERVRMY